jgi:quercetin dioxygenase-like cupin family protein
MPEPQTNQAGAEQAAGSRVVHSDESGGWAGIATQPYKRADGSWSGVTRQLLAGGPQSPSSFELRYFELAPGGRSAHETHRHEHAVVVLRGSGEVLLGSAVHALRPGDLVRVAPGDAHQFRNTGSEPLGFLCVVDADRDAPTRVEGDNAPSCSVDDDELSLPR